jgi:hypothetical protein
MLWSLRKPRSRASRSVLQWRQTNAQKLRADRSRVKRVLPIVIGDKQKILNAYPMLRNTVYKSWTGANCIPALIRDLKKMLASER